MKIVLLGNSIVFFGIAVILSFSSTGLGYSVGTKFGLAFSFLGLLISIIGFFIKDSK